VQIPRLREWREARALTQVELAEFAGLSARSIAGYEAGAGARPGTVRRLAQALDVGITDLYGEAEYPLGEAPPSQQLTLNGILAEDRRDILKNSYVEYVDERADHYDRRLEQAEQGGFFAGEEGAQVLLAEALEEHKALFMLIARNLADWRLLGPTDPAAEGAHVEATRILDRLTETLEHMCDRLEELTETKAQEEETERIREEIRRRKQGSWENAA
jgi:transcriptional regulator with XRE-family HTH domain